MKNNDEARQLRIDLYELIYRMKTLSLAMRNSSGEPDWEAGSQLDVASCELAATYEKMRDGTWDVFIDAEADRPKYS